MPHIADGIDIEGPIQAEVFVVWLNVDHLELTGPCGPAPWMIELGEVEHPVAVVDRIVRDVVGPPLLVHSTSWRRDHGVVVLSFVVVIDVSLVGTMSSAPIGRVDLVDVAYKLLIEYEGDQHRPDRNQWNRDIDRHEDFVRDHWTLIRVTSERARWPRQVVRGVYQALRANGYDGPSPEFGELWIRLFEPSAQ